ncbi:MAG: hypothetical protein KBT01_01135, partial [Clostridiales bacterium]|nr:hypothetical protein [Candidatus Blautia equi]
MKKKLIRGLFLAQLTVSMLLTAGNVFADEAFPEFHSAAPFIPADMLTIPTDYYVVVESANPDGIDFYRSSDEAVTAQGSFKLPNKSVLYIGEEVSDGKNLWGYTEYAGQKGYVLLDDCNMISRNEALQTELAHGEAADTNYDALITADAGNAFFYSGPGEKYGRLRGSSELPNGTSLHIYLEATLPDGSHWAQSNFGDKEAWVKLDDLDRTSEGMKPTPTPVPTATPAPLVDMEAVEPAEPETETTEDTTDSNLVDMDKEDAETTEDAEASEEETPEEETADAEETVEAEAETEAEANAEAEAPAEDEAETAEAPDAQAAAEEAETAEE